MEYQGPPNNSGRTSSQGLRRKRLKVPVACATCRRRKVKCDGAQPVCNTCGKSSAPAACVYYSRSSELAPPIHDECLLQKGSWDHHVLNTSEEVPPGDIVREGSQPHRAISAPSEAERVDSMNGVTGDPTQIREVFGSSSAGSFMRQIQAALDARLETVRSPAHRRPPVTGEHSLGEQPSYSSHEEPGLFLLPPRGLADGLIRAYWDNEWVLYPIINKQRIEETYESLWTSKTTGNYPLIHICILNVCFALGCHYCTLLPVKERKSSGDDFFSRAQRLYEKLGDVPSYEKAQCLLLFGIYLQSTSNVFQCWMTVGQAIRMAQCLGIHLSQPTPLPGSPSHEEYKRRTWHGCVWLDRVLSATLGRPGMIPKWLFNSVPLPSMIDDEFFETQTEGSILRPDGRPCIMAFTVKAMEFYQILDDILVTLYLKPDKDERFESKLTHILEIDARIQDWNKSLPDHLRAQSVTPRNGILGKQATVLRLRLSEVMLSECSRMCFRLAHELIDTFNRNLDPDNLSGPLPNWWYSVLYVYTATTMILVERFLETKEGPSGESTAYNTWNAALHVLKSYSALAESARRCLAALQVFSEKLCLDANSTVAANLSEEPQDWNSFWGVSDLLSDDLGMSDPSLFPFNFDDFISFDSMPGPYCHISPPHGA